MINIAIAEIEFFWPQRATEKKRRAAEYMLYFSVMLYFLRGPLWPCIQTFSLQIDSGYFYAYLFRGISLFILLKMAAPHQTSHKTIYPGSCRL